MSDKGIIFGAPMVRALLAGTKTQTRRLLKLPSAPAHLGEWEASTVGGPGILDSHGNETPEYPCVWHTRTGATIVPSYAVGDRLYVRETWRVSPDAADGWHPDELRGWIDYQAGGSEEHVAPTFEAVERAAFMKGDDRDWDFLPSRYRPCIHMPRWTSRIWLAATDVRVQRLQECNEADALAEGIDRIHYPEIGEWGWPRRRYAELWNSLHTAEGERWDDNPWIVAVTFEVHHGNIDEAQA